MIIVYIALAGAAGSVSRYLLATAIQRTVVNFPVGTLGVNVLGSFALGFLMALFASRGALDSKVRIATTIGFLGGFTTYSAFAYETIALIEEQRVGAAAAYVGLTFAVAAAACFAGIVLAKAMGE